jgi:hypothetical protein
MGKRLAEVTFRVISRDCFFPLDLMILLSGTGGLEQGVVDTHR